MFGYWQCKYRDTECFDIGSINIEVMNLFYIGSVNTAGMNVQI